jgi:hypothetical protein
VTALCDRRVYDIRKSQERAFLRASSETSRPNSRRRKFTLNSGFDHHGGNVQQRTLPAYSN